MNRKWHEERMKGVGGSEIADVLSLPPYGCTKKLWYEKRGEEPEFQREETWQMRRGKEMEDFIAKKAIELGFEIKTIGSIFMPSFPHRRGNADRAIFAPDGSEGIHEIKCPGQNVFRQIKRDGLSNSWILQLQYYLGIYNKSWGSYGILCCDGTWDYIYMNVDRDQKLIDLSFEAVDRFWKLVENGPAPDNLDPEDKRCKKCCYSRKCQGAIVDYSSDLFENAVDARGETELEEALASYNEASEILKEVDDLKKQRRKAVISLLGDRNKVITDIGKASYVLQERSSYDWTKIEKEHPGFLKKYNKTIKYPVLKVNLGRMGNNE